MFGCGFIVRSLLALESELSYESQAVTHEIRVQTARKLKFDSIHIYIRIKYTNYTMYEPSKQIRQQETSLRFVGLDLKKETKVQIRRINNYISTKSPPIVQNQRGL